MTDDEEMIEECVEWIGEFADLNAHWIAAWMVHAPNGVLKLYFLHDESFHAIH